MRLKFNKIEEVIDAWSTSYKIPLYIEARTEIIETLEELTKCKKNAEKVKTIKAWALVYIPSGKISRIGQNPNNANMEIQVKKKT